MKEVSAAIMIHSGLCLIAKRKATDRLANLWEFPGGKVEPGETLEECLRREMLEEFNIEIEVDSFFMESIYSYEHGTIKLLAYFTRWTDGEIRLTVHDEIAWIKRDQLDNYTFAPADIPIVRKLKECDYGF